MSPMLVQVMLFSLSSHVAVMDTLNFFFHFFLKLIQKLHP